jgi:hypothetical protein
VIEPLLRTRDDVGAGLRVGWELLHLLQLSVRSMEDTATRAVAAQVAGLIALWTQFYTFEEDVPKGLAWLAWLLLLASISILGIRITPRRLRAFWHRLDVGHAITAAPLDEGAEARLVEELSDALRSQRDRLERAIRTSVALGIAGLGIVALAYVVDKGLYAP